MNVSDVIRGGIYVVLFLVVVVLIVRFLGG